MAETTTRPARTRRAPAAKSTTAAKAAPAKAATPKAEEAPEAVEVEKYVIELENAGETKTYSKWVPPVGNGCVGTFYAPLGTETVRVQIVGPAGK